MQMRVWRPRRAISSCGGLHGRVCPCEGLRSGDAAAGAGGSGGSIRDAGGAAGAGGLCNVHASVGTAPRAGDGSEPLPAVVAAVLPAADHAVLIEGLESAFEWFGGVPRELLFDQMRAVVLSDGRAGELVLNADFLRFAAHWGFRPRACRPYRAQTKGKVERPIRYIRNSFFYGREFVNDEDLNEQALLWLEGTANVRRHGTTGERPMDRFERDEQQALLPLASHPYRHLGARKPPQPPRRPLLVAVDVERRSLSVYAEAVS